MSRSRKKPYIVDSSWKQYGKKRAARKVRRHDDVANGSQYKKIFESYDICDYIWYCPENKKAYRK